MNESTKCPMRQSYRAFRFLRPTEHGRRPKRWRRWEPSGIDGQVRAATGRANGSERVSRAFPERSRTGRQNEICKNVMGVCFARRFEHGRRSNEQQRTFAPHRRYSAPDVRVVAAGIQHADVIGGDVSNARAQFGLRLHDLLKSVVLVRYHKKICRVFSQRG
jgi:hypothetical protein